MNKRGFFMWPGGYGSPMDEQTNDDYDSDHLENVETSWRILSAATWPPSRPERQNSASSRSRRRSASNGRSRSRHRSSSSSFSSSGYSQRSKAGCGKKPKKIPVCSAPKKPKKVARQKVVKKRSPKPPCLPRKPRPKPVCRPRKKPVHKVCVEDGYLIRLLTMLTGRKVEKPKSCNEKKKPKKKC